jgi:phytoene/squalene synthetase
MEPEALLGALREGRELPGFERLMRGMIGRASECYRASAGLESLLNPACRATSWAMMRVYRDLLARIEADPMRVLRARVSLCKAHKLWIAGSAWARGVVRV